jgi:hypothetical protein
MSKWTQFTAHIAVETSGTKRAEKSYNLRRLAVALQSELVEDEELNLAQPSSGQNLSQSSASGFSGVQSGCGVVPQIGQTAPTLRVVGMHLSTAKNAQVVTETQRILSNEFYSGYATHHNDSNMTSAFQSDVSALFQKIQDACAASLPADMDWAITRIVYGNVVYGAKGQHFPQS